MDWIWIPIIVVIAAITIIAIVSSSYKHDKGDFKDGGGTQLGGNEKIGLFKPANEKAGIRGELFVNNHLRLLLRKDEYLLANLLLPLKNGSKNEIDCILITRKGIFCIETKNWVGHIGGNDEDEYWLQQYDDPYMSDRTHRNPVKQNETHCRILEKFLNYRFEINGAVIFPHLEDRSGIKSNNAFTISEFKYLYRSIDKLIVSETELNQIFSIINKYVATPEQLKQHRENARKRFNN